MRGSNHKNVVHLTHGDKFKIVTRCGQRARHNAEVNKPVTERRQGLGCRRIGHRQAHIRVQAAELRDMIKQVEAKRHIRCADA